MNNCSKCNEKVSTEGRFILKKCGHIFCFKCMREHVSNCLKTHKNKVEDTNTRLPCLIKCPIDNCEGIIPDIKIRECLSNTETVLYDQLALLASSTEVAKCLTKTCFYAVFVDDQVENFQCEYCGQPNCLKCKKRHDGKCNSYKIDETEINKLAERAMQLQMRHDIEEYHNSNDNIPNSEFFECPICSEYILPRKGLVLRKCLHNICRSCFDKVLKKAKTITDLVCPECGDQINDREIINVIGKSKVNDLISKGIRYKYFQCKFPDCNGSWDVNKFAGCFTCPVCKHVNCLDCEDVHEGVSCEDFKKKNQHSSQETSQRASIPCYSCLMPIFIEEGGCGSLQCKCKKYVCRYTGKAAGNLGPHSCGCTSAKLCHEDCKFGCFPERTFK